MQSELHVQPAQQLASTAAATSTANPDEVFTVDLPEGSTCTRSDNARRQIFINDHPLTVLVDSGASHNIITDSDLHCVAPNATLEPTDLEIFAYGASTPLSLCGSVQLDVSTANHSATADFAVIAQAPHTTTVLSRTTAADLRLLHILTNVESLPVPPDLPADLAPYRDRFMGLGCIRDVQAHIYVNPSAKPVVHPPSRVPAHLREATIRELHTQLDLDIIESASGPTPWVARLVIVPKQGTRDVRLTQDFRDVNAVSDRERHPIPTHDEITAGMTGAKFFSELDMNKAFHQILLDEASRQYTVFSTPLGLMRYKRLAMGLASASEILQRAMDTVLSGLEGVSSVHDNIFVFGSSLTEHDTRLIACLQRLRQHAITLNPSKCRFRQPSLTFMATTYSAQGIRSADKHKEAIDAFKTPGNVADVRSFLGLATFLRRYIPDMATITEPLRHLTKKGQPWTWTDTE